MSEIQITKSDLDFATSAAINLTLKRVQRELDEIIQALEIENATFGVIGWNECRPIFKPNFSKANFAAAHSAGYSKSFLCFGGSVPQVPCRPYNATEKRLLRPFSFRTFDTASATTERWIFPLQQKQ